MTLPTTFDRLLRKRPSRIGLRLFAFNLLVLFVPVAGILYLDVYEARLLETQERGMVQQARMVAAALSTQDSIDENTAHEFLSRVEDPGEVRVRIFDAQGKLLGDSARVGTRPQARPADDYTQEIASRRRRFLYQVGARLVQSRDGMASALHRMLGEGRAAPTADRPPGDGPPPELRAALTGRYGAAARRTPGQRSLTLNSAVPIRHSGDLAGAVVVSQSTFRILQALYDVRLRLFEIVLMSIAAAGILTRIASSTIVKPVVRLRHTAVALASRQTALSGKFSQVDRRDEIGDLARSLEELAARLDAHVRLLESVSADVAHEFKNPLAAIRIAAETMADEDDAQERRRFLAMLTRDVGRLEMLVTGVRELAQIDTELSHARREPVDVASLLRNIIDGRHLVLGSSIRLDVPPEPILVSGSADRLSQVFENLIENAASFSPEASPVEISASVGRGECVVCVRDRGPGIPPEHAERVFERFFSYRPASNRRDHMGLGLAIARTIVAGYGGSIAARNRADGGAELDVRLPVVAEHYRQHA
ncbi:MAG: stimulus-sensing domain-containing protein [Vicinamibacterales bacterium]